MNINEFESICRRASAKPVCREETPHGVIVVADGHNMTGPEQYRTVWAFGRDEDSLEIGRPVLFNHFYEDKGIHRPVTEPVRVAAALEDARNYAESRHG